MEGPAGSLSWLQAVLTLRSDDLAAVMVIEVSMVGGGEKALQGLW